MLLEGQDAIIGTESGRIPSSAEIGEKTGISNVPAQKLETMTKRLQEVESKYDGSIIDFVKKGEYFNAATATAGAITESLPFTLALMIPGMQGASIPSTIAGTTLVTGAGRKQQLIEEEDALVAQISEINNDTSISAVQKQELLAPLQSELSVLQNETAKNANAIAHGLAESLEVLLGSGSWGRSIRSIAEKEGMSKAKQFTVQVFDKVLKDNPYLAPFTEGLQEGMTTYLQNLSDIVILKQDKDVMEGFYDSVVVGAVMGTGFTAVQGAGNYAAKKGREKIQKEQIQAIGIVSKNGKLLERTMEDIDEQVKEGKITEEEAIERKKRITNSVAAYNSMPSDLTEKQRLEAFPLIEEKRALEEKIEGKDPALVAVEKERIEAINNRLTEISKSKKEETTDAVQIRQAEEVVGSEQARDSEGVESEVSEQAEDTAQGEELATTEAEVTATEQAEPTLETAVANVIDETNTEIQRQKIEGGLLNEQQSEDLQKEIESKYDKEGDVKFGNDSQDIRKNVFNYETPIARRNINGVDLRIVTGLIETDPKSNKKRKSYLLYADGKIVGKFYSIDDIKKVVAIMEKNLVQNTAIAETTQPTEQTDETKTETNEQQPMLEDAQDGGDKGQVGQESPELRTKEEVETTEQVEQQEAAETDRLLSGEAIERRQKGSFKKDGIEYKRQQPKERLKGKKGKVRFTDKVEPTFTYTLIEAEELQPSHMQGRRNANHFLPEAQPKPRTDLGSKEAEQKIASNPKLELVGEDVGAYSGAPIVNNRGEVIQGNNRASGLVQHAKNGGTLYKQQLEANAEQFGFTKEQVQGMKNPILVREVNANDEVAIELGNYDVKDLETGGSRPIDPIATSRRIPIAEKQKITDVLFQDETLTLNQSIRANYDKLRGFLSPYINQAQRQTLFASETPSAKNIAQIEDLVRQFLFDGGDPQLGEVFEGLTLSQQAVINRALPSVFSTNRDNSLISELQNAIVAANSFASANASGSFQQWTNQADMFNEGRTPKDVYTPIELAIAEKIANVKNQSDPSLKRLFDEYSAMVKGKPADLISPEVKPISKQDAITETINKQEKEQPSVNERTEKAVGEKKRADAKAKAKAELDAAKKAFNDKLRGGFQSGGLNALPEFIKLVKAYAKLGITTATDFVAKFKQDFADSTISDTELTEAFESVKEGSSKIISAENKSNAIIEKLKSDAANLTEVKKELREYINSVLQDEKLAKGYSRRDIDKIMGLISKVTPSNIDKIKAEVPAMVSDMVAKIQALKAQQRQEVTDRLNKLKDKAANNSAARKMLTEFIRENMPNAAVYSKAFADALINLTQKVTDKTISKALQTVLDKIEGKRQELKKKVLNEMYSFASKKAKAKKDLGGKRVATTVLADDRLFFEQVANILKAYLKNDIAKMQEYTDSVSDANIIAQINAKDQSGITLSSTEAMLLGRSMAFDVLGDLDGMTLEETEQVEADIKERYKEARQKFLDKRKEITDTIKEIYAEARKQIEVVAPFLYGTTPSGKKVLKGINQRNAERKSILAAMKKLGIVNSIKDYLTKLEATYIGKKSYNLIKAVATMENLIEKLDRVNEGRQFFRKNIYNVLSRANSERIENRERHNLILRALIKRNFKTKAKNINPLDYIRKQLRGEPIEVAGLINPLTEEVYTASFSMDEMLAIVTWSFNQDNVELLEKQGINQAVIDMFKAKLGDNLVNFAFDVTQYLSTSVYEKVNDVYSNLNNVMLAKIENYFPRVSVSNAIKDNVLDANNFGTMLSAQTETFIKERTPGSIEIEIVNNGFTDLLEDHLDGVARYTAYAAPARKLNYVFNSPDVNAYLEETGVKSLLKSQVQYAINPESLRDSKLDNWAISWIQSALTAKVLGFKLAQVQKQASSFVYFAPMYKTFADKKVPLLDTTAFLGEYLYAMKNPKEVFEYMWKLSPEFRDRVREGLKGNITTLESGIRNKDSFFKLTTRNDKVGDVVRAYKAVQASPTVVGDLLGVSGYYPILKQMERRGATREELQLAASEFNTMQQTKRDMDKTAAQQNPNIATTMLFMFGSQQILMLNKASIHGRNIMRSIAKREAPKLYDIEMLYFSLAVVNASFVAAGYIYKLFGDEEDREEYFEELKDAMKLKAFLFWIPILGQNIKKAMARIEGKPYRDAGYGVDPLSDVWRKAEDQLKRGKTPLYVFSRGFSEMITRTDFEPFIGFADQVVGEGHPAVNIYKMLGVSKSYRPHIYDPYYDKTLPKELKELMKESPEEFESEYGFGGFSYPDYAERDRMIRDVVMEVKKDMRAMNATEEEIEEAVSNVKERIREAERKEKKQLRKSNM
jgi:hypothetical protein